MGIDCYCQITIITIKMEAVSQESAVGVPDPSGARKPGRHPAYHVMVRRAIFTLKAKGGSSRKAIIRYICAHYTVTKSHCIKAVGRNLKRMVRSGLLYKTKLVPTSLPAKDVRPARPDVLAV